MIAFILFVIFISLNSIASSELYNAVDMIDKGFDQVKLTGQISSPCKPNIQALSAISLAPKFSSNGVGENCYKYIDLQDKFYRNFRQCIVKRNRKTNMF